MNSSNLPQRLFTTARFFLAFTSVLLVQTATAQNIEDYEAVPPLLAESAAPLVMLAMSNDHQLYYKAFTDYDDLNNDGFPNTTYSNDIEYVGYFDPYKCYIYDTVSLHFTPVLHTQNKYCARSQNNQWSGNFLNWATMTRMDQVRRVLYGGYRFNEAGLSGKTVLERTLLPNDAHSFAKYYNGIDLADLTPFGNNTSDHGDVPTGLLNNLKSGITLCNTTRNTDTTTNNSSRVNAPPLVRVVAGNYSLWNANERWQCLYHEEQNTNNGNNPAITGIYAHSSNPRFIDKARQRDSEVIGDYIARVEVCKSGLIGTESCKEYPSGSKKPVGLLQKFGDSGQVHFGLMTGSYAKNKSGGVLRKDIGSMADEVNVATDGSFITGKGGIIETINLFRIANYNYADGRYNVTDNCPWDRGSFSDGSCTNWGNPFSEIMLECYRYFAGKQPNPNFDADDNTIIPGLKRVTKWTDPLSKDNVCAQLNLIAFNASSSSYDSDGLTGFSDLNPPSGVTARTMTNKVGDGEGITGAASPQQFFVGEHGTNNNQLCTAKTITALGDVRGTCPDAPRLQGSYQAAGLAYHARITDLRPDLDEKQTVRTYGVTLAPGVPNISIPVPNSNHVVRLLPACRAHLSGGVRGNCGLVDFKIVQHYQPTANPNEYSGSFYVNWEDTEQGGDYDMDMFGLIRYVINPTSITVTTDVAYKSTPFQLGFGFVISGTTNDGFNVMSGVNDFTGFDCNNCKDTDLAKSKTFTIGTSVARLLEQPLYYAAKWGGFVDMDGSGAPNLVAEWDNRNNVTGALGSDGIPDTYFSATNPKQLEAQLTSILVNILERTAAGTSAAVVTNTGTGEGALYQALYNPRFPGANGIDAVNWVGTLNALFIDRYGFLREDSAEPFGTLTDDDNIVDVFYDAVSKKTLIQRYKLGLGGTLGEPVGAPVDVMELKPIWSAGDVLGKVTNYVDQRAAYTNSAKSGRYIFTGIDKDGDGQIGMGSTEAEVMPFEASLFDANNGSNRFRLLGLKSHNKDRAVDIVNYIRGAAVPGFRNRRIDLNGDGKLQPVLLGDIVHSSPTAVSRPSAGYDITFGDDTYRKFRQQYQNRRQVVYVGANDGMLHAFNAGFFNSTTSSYDLQRNGETPHPLGSELWAYVPYNLLPHLKWLTQPDYPHVYYVDGAIKPYDVNIFPDSAKHPGGWGTILVVGMRFGGGEYTLNPHADELNPTTNITMRSAYVVLDVTDPEQPPTLLAELTHPDMGYTLAEPTLVKMRAADSTTGSYLEPEKNEWHLVFGSGPAGNNDVGRRAALRQATSEKSAKLFVYDLRRKNFKVIDTHQPNSFVGGLQSADWTRNYMDDAIYFGTVAGSVEAATGRLRRGVLNADSGSLDIAVSNLLDVTHQPFSATPLTVRDRMGDYWIYAGTGRFYVVDDNFTGAKQSYYGVKEPQTSGLLNATTVLLANMINTTDIQVFTDGSIDSKSSPGTQIYLGGATQPAKTFTDVYQAVEQAQGWYFDLTRYRSRNITQAVISDQSLVFSEYQTSGLKCQPEGYGFLNAPHLQAGIPGSFAPLGTNPSVINGNGAEAVNMSESLGFGSPSAPTIHQRADGTRVAVVQSSTGELTNTTIASGGTQGSRQSWRELYIDWR